MSSLHVHTWGSGPRIVLGLHGWGGSHLTFVPLAPHLPPDVQLVAPDLPGYGRSAPLSTWTVDAYTAPIVELLDSLPPGPITLLGNCSGAIFGLLAGLKRPGRLQRLVLIDPFSYVPWYFRMLLWPVFGKLFYYSTFANPLGRLISNSALSRHRRADTSLTASFERVHHPSALRTLALLQQVPSVERFAPVGTDRTILHGERTFAAVRDAILDWRGIWPTVLVQPIAGSGHLPILEAPQTVAQLAFAGASV
jgi:pimeloyl-ACP methyl ester carboxylesterase